MGFDLRFQVLTVPTVGWDEYLDQFVRCEALGFDVVALADHFCDFTNPQGPWLEAWTGLAAVAASTSTIRLATCVSQIPLRHPGVLAHQAVTVDHVSGGRLELGLGTGITADPSLEMIGLPNWSNPERVERFAEYLELVGLLLSEPVTTYDGRYYSAAGAVMNPSSVQRPRVPLVVAALRPRMMALTAVHADTWNTVSYAANAEAQVDEIGLRNAAMDELCVAAGRDPATLRRGVNLFDADARAEGLEGRLRYYDDDDHFVRLVEGHLAAGITDFTLYYPSLPDQLPGFERIATRVVPELRAAHSPA